MDRSEWVQAFANEVGIEAPSEDEVAKVLDLAAVAAHGSERSAAPVACWLAAKSGRPLSEVLEMARSVVGDPSEPTT